MARQKRDREPKPEHATIVKAIEAHGAPAVAELELVTAEDALRVQLASEKMMHAQAVVRSVTLEKDMLMRELCARYALGEGDGVDFATRRIVRGKR